MRPHADADKLLTAFAVCSGPEALTASIQPIAIVSRQVITSPPTACGDGIAQRVGIDPATIT
jgi:hypothetical protein